MGFGSFLSVQIILRSYLGSVVATMLADTVNIRNRLSKDKMKDYCVTVPPTINGTVIDVTVNFYLGSLVDLNEKEQSLTTDGWLDVTWIDPRLAWNIRDYNVTGVYFKQKETWRPDLVITNTLKERKVMGYDDLLVNAGNDGYVKWSPGDIYKTRCKLDITYFPFDSQACEIRVGLWLFGEDVSLHVADDGKAMKSDNLNSVWEIVNISKYLDGYEVVILINIRRYPSYYVLNLLLPVIFISTLMPFAFALPLEKGDRVSFTVTVMLSLVVFLTLLGDTLPKTSLQTSILTIYISVLLAISALSVVLSVLILNISAINDSRPIPSWIRRTTCRNERNLRQVKKRVVPTQYNIPQQAAQASANGQSLNTVELAVGSLTKQRVLWADIASRLDAICLLLFFLTLLGLNITFFIVI